MRAFLFTTCMINIHENLIDSLNESEVYLLMHITRYMGQNGFAFPSNETLCCRTCWHPNTLKKHKRSLIEKGLIRVEARYQDQGGQTSNAYFVETDEIGIYIGARAGQKLAGGQNLVGGGVQNLAPPVVQKIDGGGVQNLAPEVLDNLSIKNLKEEKTSDATADFVVVEAKEVNSPPSKANRGKIAGGAKTPEKETIKPGVITEFYPTEESFAPVWTARYGAQFPQVDPVRLYDRMAKWCEKAPSKNKHTNWLRVAIDWVRDNPDAFGYVKTETYADGRQMSALDKKVVETYNAAQHIKFPENPWD